MADPNHLQRQCRVDAPNQVWMTGITYIRTHEDWRYLAVVESFFQLLKRESQRTGPAAVDTMVIASKEIAKD